MNTIADANVTWSRVIGIILLLLGIIGFFNKPIFGLFGITVLGSIFYIVVGLLVAWKAGSKSNSILGWITLVAGVIGFIPFINVITGWFGFTTWSHVLHLVVGVVSIGIAKMSK